MSLVRGLDGQRRLTIPQEVLRAIKAKPGGMLKIYAGTTPSGDPAVMIEKFEPGCWLCDGEIGTEYKTLHNKKVCGFCIKILRKEEE